MNIFQFVIRIHYGVRQIVDITCLGLNFSNVRVFDALILRNSVLCSVLLSVQTGEKKNFFIYAKWIDKKKINFFFLGSDCRGYMLPKSFLAAEIGDYHCDKCDNKTSSHEVDETMESIGKELASMKKNDVDTCRMFLKKYTSKLSNNHFYITDVRLALAQLIGQQPGGLPALDGDVISEKILLCKKLNDLMKTIIPGKIKFSIDSILKRAY